MTLLACIKKRATSASEFTALVLRNTFNIQNDMDYKQEVREEQRESDCVVFFFTLVPTHKKILLSD